MTTDLRPTDLKSSIRGGPIRWLIAGGASLIAAIAIGTTIMAGNFRERALRSSESQLEDTVLLLTRHFDQQLDDFMSIQKDIIAEIAASGFDSPDAFRSELSTSKWHELLRLKVRSHAEGAGVNIFDSNGRLINSSQAWPVQEVSIAGEDFFKDFKSSLAPGKRFRVQLVRGAISKDWTTVIACRVGAPNGQFLGVVTRAIPPSSFENFLGSVALAPGASISMHHRDGTLLARYPHVAGMIGRNFRTGPAEQRKVFELEHYTTRVTSPIDGRQRLVASRALAKFPLVIVATTTVSAALADWQEQTWFLIAIGAASVFLIAGLLFVVVRRLSRDHRASQQRLTLEKQRLDRAVNNMTQGLLLFDASTRLVICNNRYIEMYGLSADIVKPGCSFHDIIEHRSATGSLQGDTAEYIRSVLTNIDRKQVNVIETSDGRAVQIVNEPLDDGGWLATHEDITERREMDAKVRARRTLETDLREALSAGALEVHYQPCVSLQDGRITGCEALVRWRQASRGMVSPAEFIPVAEDTGLINQVGEWVLTTACREAANWPGDVRLAVNVSPIQFKSATLALKIMAALASSGLPASRLELEITEAVLIRDDEAALAILHRLRAIGVRIALDDFGTGYSSLSYLQRFPFDKIKIDRCFIRDLDEKNDSSSIVQAVVNIAAARHMTTTAEGVETEAQRQQLRALGCSEMQGYLFSAARRADEIRELLARAPAGVALAPRRRREQLPKSA